MKPTHKPTYKPRSASGNMQQYIHLYNGIQGAVYNKAKAYKSWMSTDLSGITIASPFISSEINTLNHKLNMHANMIGCSKVNHISR